MCSNALDCIIVLHGMLSQGHSTTQLLVMVESGILHFPGHCPGGGGDDVNDCPGGGDDDEVGQGQSNEDGVDSDGVSCRSSNFIIAAPMIAWWGNICKRTSQLTNSPYTSLGLLHLLKSHSYNL